MPGRALQIIREQKNTALLPSAGATYPINLYVMVNNVSGLKKGIYLYNVDQHGLEPVQEGDHREEITKACYNQKMLQTSGINIILTAVFKRIFPYYYQRSERYIFMEAGHIGQNIQLQAVSLSLGAVHVGAFSDAACNRLLNLDPQKESVTYIIPVGVFE